MMKPYYQDNLATQYCGDARSMAELPGNSVQCVVTSPPYWGLRKYSGLPDLIWGGDEKCEHQWGKRLPAHHPGQVQDGKAVTDLNALGQTQGAGNFCSLCGAWKGSYGLEPTPEMYIEHTIEFLREIRRVLRKDGVVFWNIGDSYCGYKGDNYMKNPETSKLQSKSTVPACHMIGTPQTSGLKPKDLCLIPFRVAISAQADGWWVRSVIIWSKPNPMPESVTDRPTESHEYILMLTKSSKYYWDQEAVRESHKPETLVRYQYGYKESERDKLGHSHHGKGYQRNDGSPIELNAGRNLRTVWEFPTQPYPEAHFAVFPEKLPELCIKAATPEAGCCSKCGAPWERIVEVDYKKNRPSAGNDPRSRDEDRLAQSREIFGSQGWRGNNLLRDTKTLGWQPTCKCNADKVPSIVLDPFSGSGTTLWVAKKLGRRAVGYELSSEYCQLALERNRQMAMEL